MSTEKERGKFRGSHEDLARLRQGVEVWNVWRKKNPKSPVNLTDADLARANLTTADLHDAKLRGADFYDADLYDADLTRTNLTEANLTEANLTEAQLSHANLTSAYLFSANLTTADLRDAKLHRANLTEAELPGANLTSATLIETNLTNADLRGCHVYGISAWELKLEGAKQQDLVITKPGEPQITVDNLEVAQFLHLFLKNEKLRNVIETITSKTVLILGRFTPERKAVLDAIRDEIRNCNLLPILFDFDKPSSRDLHETITTLARMARFVIADITDPKSVPQELVSIVEQLPSLPVQPILLYGMEPWAMFDHIKRYPWVLPLHEYRALEDLVPRLHQAVIAPAEAKVSELKKSRGYKIEMLTTSEKDTRFLREQSL